MERPQTSRSRFNRERKCVQDKKQTQFGDWPELNSTTERELDVQWLMPETSLIELKVYDP
jgi:hypothetical protein